MNGTVGTDRSTLNAERVLCRQERIVSRKAGTAVQHLSQFDKLIVAEYKLCRRSVAVLAHKCFAIIVVVMLKELVDASIVEIVAATVVDRATNAFGVACTGNGHDEAVVGRCRCLVWRRDALTLTRTVATQSCVSSRVDDAIGLLAVIRRWFVEDTGRLGIDGGRRIQEEEYRRQCLMIHFHWDDRDDMYLLFFMVGA